MRICATKTQFELGFTARLENFRFNLDRPVEWIDGYNTANSRVIWVEKKDGYDRFKEQETCMGKEAKKLYMQAYRAKNKERLNAKARGYQGAKRANIRIKKGLEVKPVKYEIVNLSVVDVWLSLTLTAI